ncbi:ATP-binding protein [Streptomyces sp. NPDC052236]|uniref:ATP-binding protein n=1 Tax=Streptomyces sp. NPDC052236 TaxID=3365686 RepID=UPI0037CF8ACB
MSARIAEALSIASSDRIADIGSGTGLFAREVSRIVHPEQPILCVDPSEAMLRQINRQSLPGLTTIPASTAGLPAVDSLIGTAARLEPLLRSNVRTRIVGEGFRETPRPDYPLLEALREICMNALMHRNYETSYAPTRIVWFDDCVEVTNPGGPFGQVRDDNFDVVTDYRNPSLAAALKGLGYVNRFGRGIGRVRAALERNGNPPAEFQVDDSSWP